MESIPDPDPRAAQDATTSGAARFVLGGTEFWLDPERAVWWPGERTLVVADLHLGRPPVDQNDVRAAVASATSDLDRLDRLVTRYGATRTVVLGDLRHAAAPHLRRTDDVLREWSLARPTLVLIRGNQDEAAGDPPRDWNIRTEDQGWSLGGLRLYHHPPEARAIDPSVFWLAGHLHPGSRRDAASSGPERSRRDSEGQVAPSFLSEGHGLVLPAFGSGTRAHPPRARRDQHLLPIRDGRVLVNPTCRGRSS